MSKRIIVLGTVASNPYAGMAWMTMQIAKGLQRLGHDVYYYETTSDWPYDPIRQQKVTNSDYALHYLAATCSRFGLGERWAYRASYLDQEWRGPARKDAGSRLEHADAVLNIAGATSLREDGLKAGRLVLVGTDPVVQELQYAEGEARIRQLVDEHDDCVTYGENIGTPACPVPPLPRLRSRIRQPILTDLWTRDAGVRNVVTTIGNWRQKDMPLRLNGEEYLWSKHHEFMRFMDLPRRISVPIEFATNLTERPNYDPKGNEAVPAFGLDSTSEARLVLSGWRLADSHEFSMDPWLYRNYILESKAEFTVARDLNVRLQSGWFSERSACYLAAGKPVITQDTGFGSSLPTGEGLFAFATMDDIVAAFELIEADYPRHSAAARAIAEEFFQAEVVLARMLSELGI